jgi:hypothetical protein
MFLLPDIPHMSQEIDPKSCKDGLLRILMELRGHWHEEDIVIEVI